MKRLFIVFVLIVIASTLYAQSNISAEAVGQANLRASADINADLVGEIVSGTRYPVIGRSEFYPWLLLGDPDTQQPLGWVYADLVTVYGDPNSVPFTTVIVDQSSPTPTLPAQTPSATQELVGVFLPQTPTATATADLSNLVTGTISGEVNIRFGPGIDYPRLGLAEAGERFVITAWHTQLPWVQIRYDDSPNGLGWIALDLLDIQGDLYSLPAISQINFNLPTLTPTPPILQSSAILGGTPVPLSPEFASLGSRLWDILLNAGFDPATSTFGALFVMDLQTHEAMSFGSEYAFSGTSIQKINILNRLYGVLNQPPDTATAIDIANTMICSENTATNHLLEIIGGGDPWLGAEAVTDFGRQLGFENTFITAPYSIPGATLVPPSEPIELPQTNVDQVKANPDSTNQLTVDEMGQALAAIYQCAYEDSGPLLERFGDQYEGRECRQMLDVMSHNTVDALLKSGVPADTRVAHKHGWIDDTHGNAAIIFTPGGNYVIVIMLYNPVWLDFQESLPVIAEVSRQVYNYYNPDAPMLEIRQPYIPAANSCNFTSSPLINDLIASRFDQ